MNEVHRAFIFNETLGRNSYNIVITISQTIRETINTMEATLRQVGNSTGITFPAQVLRDLSARLGDIIEIQITQVKPQIRADWNHPTTWQGAQIPSTQLLADVPAPDFDTQDWTW